LILAFDTYYFNNNAKTVCIGFTDWTAAEPDLIWTETRENIEEYVPGEFYKREMPCILSLLQKIGLTDCEAIIIDGYVHLDDKGKPGLGAHLYNKLHLKVAVIGVAKSNFKTLNKSKVTLLRGQSISPLYITAIGYDVVKASNNIAIMAGLYRIPTLLKLLDSLTKERN
jgi:deoxyribonuclease V